MVVVPESCYGCCVLRGKLAEAALDHLLGEFAPTVVCSDRTKSDNNTCGAKVYGTVDEDGRRDPFMVENVGSLAPAHSVIIVADAIDLGAVPVSIRDFLHP